MSTLLFLNMRVERSPYLNSTFLLLSFRFLFPESPQCHFLRARSLPGHVSQPQSPVREEQGPELWQTSRPKPSKSGPRGQRPPPQPPPPPRPHLQGEQCQGPGPAVVGALRVVEERRVTQHQAEPRKLELEEMHWNWQELEAGEVREGFFPIVQGPVPKWRPRPRTSHQLTISLEHNYSKLPHCNPELQAAIRAPPAPHQRHQH